MAGGNLPRMNKPGRKHVRVGHVSHGKRYNKKLKQQEKTHSGSGWHHRPGGNSPPNRRIVKGTRTSHGSNGVYSAKVEFYDPGSKQWLPKNGEGRSTFFPDHWNNDQVNAAIEEAKANSTPHPNNPKKKWLGESNGISIEGFNEGYAHGWPTKKQ